MAKSSKSTSANTWRSRYELAANSQERMFKKFADYYDLQYAHINTSLYALWRSKVYIPILPSKATAMVAKLKSYKPGFEVGLYGSALLDKNAQDKADKSQWRLEHDWDNPLFDETMDEKLDSPLWDAVITGTGIGKVPWCYGSKSRYEKYEDDNGEMDPAKDVKIDEDTGYNELIPHDIMSTYVAPGSKNLYSAKWVILEDWVTYDDLKAENDAAGFELNKNLKNVEDLKGTADRFAQEKKSRDLFLDTDDPLPADTTINQFKRLECYELSTMKLYSYAVGEGNGSEEDSYVELRNTKLPYWHGKYPLVAFYIKRRPFSFWGEGIYEGTERMVAAFNDIFNHYMDNLNLSLDGMVMKQEGEAYTYVVEPGGEFLYKNTEPKQFKFPEPNPAQFETIMNFIEAQVEEATISSYATGTPNSATDKTTGTASGILQLTQMAGDKVGFMKQNYAASMRQIGRQWLSNNQQFISTPFAVKGKDKDNRPAAVEVKPKDLQGQMTLRINDASMEPPTKEQELAQFTAYVQQLTVLQQASVAQAQQTRWAIEPLYVDFAVLFQDFSFKMGQANYDKILLAGKEVMQAMQNSQTPLVMPNERVMIDINELYGSEAAQLLQRNGITADPQRTTQVPTAAVQAQLDANAQALDVQKAKVDGASKQVDMVHKIGSLAHTADSTHFDQAHKVTQLAQSTEQTEYDRANPPEVPVKK